MAFDKITSCKVNFKQLIEEVNLGMTELFKAMKQLKSKIKTLHHATDQQNKKIERLEDKLDMNQIAVIIGKKMLNLPNKKKLPANPEGLKVYSMM